MFSGFLFGLGWWLWIDAVVNDDVKAWAQVLLLKIVKSGSFLVHPWNFGNACNNYYEFCDGARQSLLNFVIVRVSDQRRRIMIPLMTRIRSGPSNID